MLCVCPTEHRSSVLDHGMLETATGSEERAAMLSGYSDRAKRSLGAPVRAGGHTPDRVVIRDGCVRRDRVRWHPLGGDVQADDGGGKCEGIGDGAVGGDGRVIVA
jgi:hypothetical protein